MLHQRESEANYRLRRYFPHEQFQGFIEQFWLVNWHLPDTKPHIQRNLPDPNFHLVISKEQLKVYGPVSKVYSYRMVGAGRLIGVKFEVGALQQLLPDPIGSYIDKELDAKEVFGPDAEDILLPLYGYESDTKIVSELQDYLASFISPISVQLATTQHLVSVIKNNAEICRVEQLSACSNLSPRAIQRYFATYVGLPPKWLIRKYRLGRALEELENDKVDILDIVSSLEYVDQSHLIRDFQHILGITPSRYMKHE